MILTIRNLGYIRESLGPRVYEAIRDLVDGISRTATQVAANPNALMPAPPAVSSLTVSASNGLFHAVIFDNNPVLRGIEYFLEWSTTPNFAQPHVISLGPSREHWTFFGNQTLYFRAYSQYPASGPSEPVYFGSQSSPTAVAGGGTITGPAPLPSPGSGTAPSSGLRGGAGYGHEPTRGNVRLE